MSIGKTKKEPLKVKGPTAPYDGYDERDNAEEKVRQALAFLQVLFYFLKNRDLNKLPTNSRKYQIGAKAQIWSSEQI